MSKALYRTYRPQQFDDVVHQEHVVKTLQQQIASGNVAHAYIFTGPRGVGKTSVARILAKQINAKSIAKHNLENAQLLDIIEIDAASNTGVDNVRDNIIQNAYTVPTQLEYKVFIIDEVHMLSASAFNALLKILEEPPKHVIFILATTEVHKIPETVLSRCQRFDFHAISMPDIVKRLQWVCQQEKIEVEQVVLERIARRAHGAIRDAESILGQLIAIGGETITAEQADIVLPRIDIELVVDLADHLQQKQVGKYISVLQLAVDQGMQMPELYKQLLELLRQGMLYSVDAQLSRLAEIDTTSSVQDKVLAIFQRAKPGEFARMLDVLLPVGKQFGISPIPQLPLEMAGLLWCVESSAPTTLPSMAAPVAPTDFTIATPEVPAPPAPATGPEHRQVAPKTLPAQPKPDSAAADDAGTESSSVVASAASGDAADLAKIQDGWKNIVSSMRGHNHALAMSVSLAHVISLDAKNTLKLGTKFDFHRSRIMEASNIESIVQVVSDVTGLQVSVECVADDQYDIDESILNDTPSDNIAHVQAVDNVWDLALNTLGGKEVGEKPAN